MIALVPRPTRQQAAILEVMETKRRPLGPAEIHEAGLRLDLMVAIGVGERGLPGAVSYGHILPPNRGGKSVEVQQAPSIYELDLDLAVFLRALETELEQKMAETVDLSDIPFDLDGAKEMGKRCLRVVPDDVDTPQPRLGRPASTVVFNGLLVLRHRLLQPVGLFEELAAQYVDRRVVRHQFGRPLQQGERSLRLVVPQCMGHQVGPAKLLGGEILRDLVT